MLFVVLLSIHLVNTFTFFSRLIVVSVSNLNREKAIGTCQTAGGHFIDGHLMGNENRCAVIHFIHVWLVIANSVIPTHPNVHTVERYSPLCCSTVRTRGHHF